MIKFRFHRGGLEESMQTCVELENFEALKEHIKSEFPGVVTESIRIEDYSKEPDERIGWKHTKVVKVSFGEELFPIGFCEVE